MKTFKELLEGKFVDTHLGNGRPNPNHPAYATHKATYDQFKHDSKSTYAKMNLALKTPRAKQSAPDLDKIFFDLTQIISQFFPDGDPADYFPKYYAKTGINYEIARKAFKKNGYKDEYAYIDDMKTGDYGYNESVVPDHMQGKRKPKVSAVNGAWEVLGNKGQLVKSFSHREHGGMKAALVAAQKHFKQNYDSMLNEEWEPDPLDKGSAEAHALSKTARNDTTGHVHLKALAAHKHMLAAHKEAHAKVAPQHKRFHELAIRDHETQIKRHTQMAKAFGHLKESEEVDGVENDISKEQRKIYDAQTKIFMKDAKANKQNNTVKESMSSFKEYINELSSELDEVSTAKMSHQGKSVIKGIKNPDVTQRMAAHDVKPGIKGYADRIALLRDAKAKGNLKEENLEERDNREDDEHGGLDKPVKRDEFDRKTGKRIYMPPNSPYKGQWKKKPGVDESVEQLEESPFDWKNKPSEVKWNDDSKDSGDNSGVHSARTKSRNAEGGALEKKSVGRPVGKHDGYKIDRAARDTPEHKTALSKKVIAAKADGFKQQGEFKSIVNRGLAKDALDKAGINPDDHKAAIEKHVKKAAGKFYSPHGQ